MNKGELIDNIATDAKITKKKANKMIDSFTSSVITALSNGDKVTIIGFGTFSISNRLARYGRNPQTGDKIKIKATKLPRFKASKSISETFGKKN